ncbi:LysR family transcriptional regulator, partial [Actinospica sp. MGRD01-02]
ARTHPLLEPRITELDPAAVPAALRAADLDVALIHEYDFVPAHAEPGLSSRELFTEPLYLAAPEPGALGDHSHSPWIVSPSGTLCRTMAERACEANGFSPRVRHEADDFDTVLALVALGQGVAIIPHLGALDPPAGVTLTRLPAFRRTQVAYRTGAAGHPAIAAVTRALRDAVPADLRSEAGQEP